MERILEFISRAVRGRQMGLPCVMRLEQDDVRMELLEVRLPCGHVGYVVELEFHSGDEWIPIAVLRDFNLDASIDLLKQSQKCVDNWRA